MQDNYSKEYKIAVDLGTTTIELAIIDKQGSIIATDYFKNPQSLYGRDVITRINTATRDKKFVKVMKDLVLNSMKESIINLLSSKSIGPEQISDISICGNTTMNSILLEYDLEELGVYPFNHRLEGSVIMSSKEVFYEDFPFECQVILSGCLSTFIGGDVLAGLLEVEAKNELSDKDSYLFLDLGTNGEMVLAYNNTYYTTSCACGPAFEASSRCTNIYGSTLIYAISLGIKTGKLSKEGILEERYLSSGIDIMGVPITADILRDILLAKAAIRTGIDILLSEAGVDIDQLSHIYIAGGFGFYLNIDNAAYIGLIPKEFVGKVEVLGNTSLKGAIKILLDNSNLKLMDSFKSKAVKLIQMANIPDYQDRLINNMYFK